MLTWRWSRLSRRGRARRRSSPGSEAGGRVESANEPVDTTTAGGRSSREVLLATAFEPEFEEKSEQWRETPGTGPVTRLPHGGDPRFGYTRTDDGTLVPDPVTGPLLRGTYLDPPDCHDTALMERQRPSSEGNSVGTSSPAPPHGASREPSLISTRPPWSSTA